MPDRPPVGEGMRADFHRLILMRPGDELHIATYWAHVGGLPSLSFTQHTDTHILQEKIHLLGRLAGEPSNISD